MNIYVVILPRLTLNIAKVQPNITSRSDRILLVAAFRETFDYICLSSKKSHECRDSLPAFADLLEHAGEVFIPSNEDSAFNRIRFSLKIMNQWTKGICNIIARKGRH